MKYLEKYSLLLFALILGIGIHLPLEASAAIISQANWKLRYVDSQELVGENGAAINAFDGNPATIWHTEWKLKQTPLPHEIQIDLGAVYSLDGFMYLPRQDGGINGTIVQYQFYVSTDGINWGTPVAQGTFAGNLIQKEILFAATIGRYVRLVALKEINNKIYTSVAELNLLGTVYTGNLAPESTIDSPSGNITINKGASVNFAGTGIDPDNHSPLTYLWKFGDPAIANTTVEDPGLVTFNNVGTYTVTFTVTDALLKSDSTPASRIVTVLDSTATPLVPQTNWKLKYVDSQELVGENGAAINAFDGNPATIWHTEWKLKQTPLPHEIQIDLGAVYSLNGFRYLPRQDGGVNGTIGQYQFYVSTDGTTWGTPVAQGTYAATMTQKEVLFTAITGRYVRLVALKEINNKIYTSVAELNLLGTLSTVNLAPESTIDSPSGNVTINVGASVNFTGTGTDPDFNSPLTYLWNFGDGMIANATVEDPGLIKFNNAGTYTVKFTVTDALGKSDPTPASRIITVQSQGGNQAPQGAISQPVNNVSINVGSTVNFLGTASDPDNNTPLTYLWDFGDPAIADVKVKDPGLVKFNKSGTYLVTFTVVDALGLADPTPALVYVNVLNSGTDPQLPQNNWSLLYVDSQELAAEDGAATNAFDGDPQTIWHTKYLGGAPYPPHQIQINLGTFNDINGFRYLPRQDGGLTGRIDHYEFYVSTNGTSWGTPVAQGAFVNSPFEQEIRFPVVTGKYVRLVATTEVNDLPYTTVAELNILGGTFSGNYAPESTINTPVANVTIGVGGSVNFTGTGSDFDNNQPLTYLWNFGDPLIPSARVKDPGLIQFSTAGTYVVSFTVVDALGRADATPATRVVNVEANSADNLIPQANMSLQYVDSEELLGENGAATNAFDGNVTTIWHTEWSASDPPPPHEIQINLGSAYEIYQLDYLPRQVGTNGTIIKYEVYVSRDGFDWGVPVGTGTLAADSTKKRIVLTPKLGQFIALVALRSVNDKPWTTAAEINVKGRCTTPYVKILEPEDYSLSPSTNVTVVPSVCLNTAQYSGWGVKFTLDGGRPYIDRSAPYSVIYQNVARTEHTVEAVVVDANGVAVSGTLTQDQVTHVGVGDYYVAIGDSITAGAFDDISYDNISLDGRNVEGGYTPILNNLLTASKGYPHTVVMEAIPGFTSAEGLVRMPAILSRHPDSQYFLLLYGTNDAGGLLPVTPTKFKTNMQQMITLIKSSGKQAYLAKIPYTLDAGRNSVIRNYNVVIDQLISENSISITPPDFYSYFATHQDELIDKLHPDGRGYQAMANMWHAVLQ